MAAVLPVEELLQRLEDIEAIRKLKNRYSHYANVGEGSGSPEKFAALFTEPASDVDRMKHRLKTIQGRTLYALRKQTVEPVFGIIKSVICFRQFLLRGLAAVRGGGGRWSRWHGTSKGWR